MPAEVRLSGVWNGRLRGLVLACNGPQPPTEREEEALQWTGTKTFEVMPVPETYVKAPGTRAEGEAVVPMPIHMLPHKIQLRIAEAPLVTTRAQETPDALLCKVCVMCMCVCVCMYVCVCACVRERERECVCVCMCV